VLAKLEGVKRQGNGWQALCPTHEDKKQSLSITESDNGKVLTHCFAGCAPEQVWSALHLETNGNGRREIAAYDYRDEGGNLLYQSVRFEPKDFRQRRPDGQGGWDWKLNGTPRVLYRLPELLAADFSRTVLIVEGEKDVDRLSRLKLIATTNSGGAGKWRDAYNEPLRGRKIVILPDKDIPGRKHAQQVAESLRNVAESVRIVELPGLPDKGDVSDWLDAGGTIQELRKLVNAAALFELKSQKDVGLEIVRMAEVEREEVDWLWHPYIALGKLTLLEGDPGIGKSWITAALACAVSRGRGLPGMQLCEAGNVLMLTAEDGLADTLRPRLDAVGADLSRVFALNEPLIFDEAGLLRLETAIIEYKPILVTIDPLFAFTGGRMDINRANECRTVTARLAMIAEKYSCAEVGVRHLGKSRGMGHALNAGIGSIDLVAAARSVLLAGKDPDDENKRAVTQIKSNLAPHGPAIGYTLRGGEFFWTGESDLTAERILSYAASESERPALDEAVEFLREELIDGDCDSNTIQTNARKTGITNDTLRRAKARLGIKSVKRGAFKEARWFWVLPEDVEAPAEGAAQMDDPYLRTSGANKTSYDNDLAEDADGSHSKHLRQDEEHLRDEIYFPPGCDIDEVLERYAIEHEGTLA
jgi:hypothetical protein